ncbi:arrestin domain-containing protein 3-like [Physella acuta]|uniref:arrestin domain-containing protein 3-like n=1 Tax=Physella acuta TaxID=109671 RepID=UPI0027DE70AC|nr:arrestin domain-containing protein 3-like [Physella acuta]
MGKLKTFEISFGNGSGVYYPGNAVDGHVTVELTEPMKMKGIRLQFDGSAFVKWANETLVPRFFTSTENYFHQESLVFGPNEGSETKELPSGRHTFPFQFILPLGLPSSFEAIYDAGTSYVRYSVSCNIDDLDNGIMRPFTVISLLDLNQHPESMAINYIFLTLYILVPFLWESLQATDQMRFTSLCCKSGPIQATFKIERQGFVPGEAIKLFAEINNGSNETMDAYVDLYMIRTYHAQGRSRNNGIIAARVTCPPIEKFSEDTRTAELVIPALPPSFLTGCNIIDIRYLLQLTVRPLGLGLGPHVPLGIIIGNIPHVSAAQMYPPKSPPPQTMDRVHAWGTVSSPPSTELPPSGIPNLPPISYVRFCRYKVPEEGDDEHTALYMPVYPYYNFGHTPVKVQNFRF